MGIFCDCDIIMVMDKKSEKRKVRFLKGCLIVATAVIIGRLFQIQILDYDKYVALAKAEHVSENVIDAKRGEIYMMDGNEPVKIVMSETVFTVIFDPLLVDETEAPKVLEEYAKDKIVVDFKDVFSDKTRRYYVVAKNVEYSEAKKIEEAGLIGVSFEKTTKRVYPEGELGSQLLGFVNADGVGQYGIEGAFNEKLSGTDGSLKAVRDVNGIALSIGDDNVETPAVDGGDVVVTIDRNIQARVEQILQKKVDESDATNASAIVMDPRNGQVMAMANVPNYDPSDYGNVRSADDYKNYVLEEAFEPASICKAFTFAAGVDKGLIDRWTPFVAANSIIVDETVIESADKTFNGVTIDMQTAFAYSLNVGSVTILEKIGNGEINREAREILYDYFKKLGLTDYTGIELFEVPGFVPTPEQYDYAMNLVYATLTFGQGMNLTMLQVAAAYAAIINGGNYFTPTIIAGEFGEDGEFVRAEKRKPTRTGIISEEASEEMRAFFYRNRMYRREAGVDKPGYYIGGKTGTGQVVLADGSYSDGEVESLATYVGFGGTEGEEARYLVMVKVWGAGHHFGGDADAQPLFDEISNFLLSYLKIRPNV